MLILDEAITTLLLTLIITQVRHSQNVFVVLNQEALPVGNLYHPLQTFLLRLREMLKISFHHWLLVHPPLPDDFVVQEQRKSLFCVPFHFIIWHY